MSVYIGLTKNLEIVSSHSNQLNYSLDVSRKIEKVSSIYRISDKYYSFGLEKNLSANYPLQNEQKDILLKPNYVYSLVCKDAVTKEVINPADLDFQVLKINGDYNYSIEKTETSFNLKFNNLSKNKVIKITIKVKGSNYLQTYAQIISGLSTFVQTQEIDLVALNNTPNGVTIGSLSLSQDNNGTIQNYILTVPASASKYETASFEIPAGTKFYDKDGNRLSGDITFTVGHFSPTNSTSLSLFHSGWTLSNIIVDNQELADNQTLEFITSGFFSITATDNSGLEAVTITSSLNNEVSPIKCKSSIKPNFINPDTNLPFTVGETVPYWRLNPNGLWEEHSTAVVKNDGEGLVFEFDMVSFSQGNLDQTARCNSGERFFITMTPSGVLVGRSLS